MRDEQLGKNDLAGLTFYCAQPETVRVYVESQGTVTPVHPLRVNAADEAQRRSVTILASGQPGHG